MLYHCGLLSERPEKDATLQWVRRGGWDLQGTPPEIEFERKVWLSMPGFPAEYHARTLGVGPQIIARHLGRDYEELKEVVAENWLSCTREDAVKLSQIRPKGAHLPVICQLAMIDDLKRGLTQTKVAKEYRVTPPTVAAILHGGIRPGSSFIPKGFELIRL